jgi:hypothetical protein
LIQRNLTIGRVKQKLLQQAHRQGERKFHFIISLSDELRKNLKDSDRPKLISSFQHCDDCHNSMSALIPISTFFIGCHGLLALGLSYQVVMERTRTRIWHGADTGDIASQPDYLKQPNAWAALIEKLTQQTIATKESDNGVLQRTIRAHGNFIEYVPLGLLFLVALEFMQALTGFLWLLGATLLVSRIFHAWGVIETYGPSPKRAIGFFGTWLVYIMGSAACLYYSLKSF